MNLHERRRAERQARRLWNEGDLGINEIAAVVGMSVDTVLQYLASQPGWPDLLGVEQARCRVCSKWFPRRYSQVYCSRLCVLESRRQSYWRCLARRRGKSDAVVPPRQKHRGRLQDPRDKRVMDMASREAKERGVSRDAVLREWKFEPVRSVRT